MEEFLSFDDKKGGSATSEKHSSEGMMPKTGEKSMEKRPGSTMENAGVKASLQNIRLLKDHGEHRIQICFRITEVAWKRLTELSTLFNMTESDYSKAVLYKDLGCWSERLDYRRRKRK
jgi:hypothetical protein